jgi:hypothetical protein
METLSPTVKKLARDPEVRIKIRQVLDAESSEASTATVQVKTDGQSTQAVKITKVKST